MDESGTRVKFKLRRLEIDEAILSSDWLEMVAALKTLEEACCTQDLGNQRKTGNIAVRTRDGIMVSKSGRESGKLGPDDFVKVVSFDSSTWEASYISKHQDILPTSDTPLFTNSGSWGNISLIVRRQTGTGERENGQIVRCNAAWGG